MMLPTFIGSTSHATPSSKVLTFNGTMHWSFTGKDEASIHETSYGRGCGTVGSPNCSIMLVETPLMQLPLSTITLHT